ncbi:hypothetical protein BDV27DRAFT_126945 [Aspergillus caelatus]|uniref:Uncharacterized protein n=1 Tax=Aspergillus caelatus TaxID=61420 RepID=A0A5N7A6D9_9EURO|nr:uncharacterized protein BDV27DRAFT_126945 [Aspergillus caelatus]KAE8365424.1 hypothetical protein BDV27DRAFT_126945 [Aspergillus caelatus]
MLTDATTRSLIQSPGGHTGQKLQLSSRSRVKRVLVSCFPGLRRSPALSSPFRFHTPGKAGDSRYLGLCLSSAATGLTNERASNPACRVLNPTIS